MNGSAHVGLDAYTESGEWQIINTIAQSDDQVIHYFIYIQYCRHCLKETSIIIQH